MRRPTTPTRPAPGSRPVPLDSRLRGNDSRVRRGDHPTTNPAPSVTPVGPLRPSRRSPPSFPPVPSIIPASPPSVIPAGCKRESMVFSPPPKTDMRRPTTPTRPAPGSRPVPLDSRLRGNDRGSGNDGKGPSGRTGGALTKIHLQSNSYDEFGGLNAESTSSARSS